MFSKIISSFSISSPVNFGQGLYSFFFLRKAKKYLSLWGNISAIWVAKMSGFLGIYFLDWCSKCQNHWVYNRNCFLKIELNTASTDQLLIESLWKDFSMYLCFNHLQGILCQQGKFQKLHIQHFWKKNNSGNCLSSAP